MLSDKTRARKKLEKEKEKAGNKAEKAEKAEKDDKEDKGKDGAAEGAQGSQFSQGSQGSEEKESTRSAEEAPSGHKNCQTEYNREYNSCSQVVALITKLSNNSCEIFSCSFENWNLKVHTTLIPNSHRPLPLTFRPRFFHVWRFTMFQTLQIVACRRPVLHQTAKDLASRNIRRYLSWHRLLKVHFCRIVSVLLKCGKHKVCQRTRQAADTRRTCTATRDLMFLYDSNFGTILADWVERAFVYSESGAEGVGTNALYSVINLSNAWKVYGPGTIVMLCNLRLRYLLASNCQCHPLLMFILSCIFLCYILLWYLAMPCHVLSSCSYFVNFAKSKTPNSLTFRQPCHRCRQLFSSEHSDGSIWRSNVELNNEAL